MPQCQNCSAHVTSRYVRVVCPGDEPRVCPHCPDMIRDATGEPRDVRSTRNGRTGQGPTPAGEGGAQS